MISEEKMLQVFNEEKMLQVIGYLLLLNGNRMNMSNLIYDLHLIDCESFNERQTTVSGYIPRNSPNEALLMILSMTFKSMELISTKGWNYYLHSEDVAGVWPDLVLDKKTPEDRLSKKDKEYIEKVYNRSKTT